MNNKLLSYKDAVASIKNLVTIQKHEKYLIKFSDERRDTYQRRVVYRASHINLLLTIITLRKRERKDYFTKKTL